MAAKPGPVCPYCGDASVLVPDTAIYSRFYGGNIWLCKPCDAYVGCHGEGYKPLGRLANKSLRALKIRAHAEFDPWWKAAIKLRGWSKHGARFAAYRWLAEQMKIPVEECHIGMFDEQRTKLAIEILEQLHRKRARKGETDSTL